MVNQALLRFMLGRGAYGGSLVLLFSSRRLRCVVTGSWALGLDTDTESGSKVGSKLDSRRSDCNSNSNSNSSRDMIYLNDHTQGLVG